MIEIYIHSKWLSEEISLKVRGSLKDFLTVILIYQLDAHFFFFFWCDRRLKDATVLSLCSFNIAMPSDYVILEYYQNLVCLQKIYFKDLEIVRFLEELILDFKVGRKYVALSDIKLYDLRCSNYSHIPYRI